MLAELSTTKTWWTSLSASASSGASRKKGRATASASRRRTRIRSRRRMRFSSCMRRRVFFRAARRNSIAAQRIRRNFWRWRRWMMTGMSPPRANHRKAGLKNPMLAQMAPDRQAAGHVFRELDVQRLVGRDPDVVDRLLHAALAEGVAELLDLLQVRLAEGAGVDEELGVVLEALEEGHALEGDRKSTRLNSSH